MGSSSNEVLAVREAGVRQLVAPALERLGLELWDVELSPASVRILVERPGGVDLDSLSSATQAISPLLDGATDLTPDGTYSLEVSSPGIERTLRTRDQYQRYIGEKVSVKCTSPIAGSRRHVGTLVAAGEESISVQLDSGQPDPLELPLDCVERTRTVLVWGAAPKPSPSRAGRPAAARHIGATASQGVAR